MDFVTWVLLRYDSIMAEANKQNLAEGQAAPRRGPERVAAGAPEANEKPECVPARFPPRSVA